MTSIDPVIDEYPLSDEEIADLQRLERLKREQAALQEEIDYLTEWAAKTITKAAHYERDDLDVTVTVVRGQSTSVDLEALREINPDLAAEITKQVIDTTQFKKAQDLGFFKAGRAESAAVVVAPKKPYVKFTAKPKKETSDV